MITWILILILVGPDATWTGYTYPSDAHPQHWATASACKAYGAGMADGDGDNEHAVCAPMEYDGPAYRPGDSWCDGGEDKSIVPDGWCGPGELRGDGGAG